MKAFVVGFDGAARERLRRAFEPAGARLVEVADRDALVVALGELSGESVAVVVEANAATALLAELTVEIPCLVAARQGELAVALSALSAGAFDALPVPLDAESCALAAWRVCDHLRARDEARRLEGELAERHARLVEETAALEADLADEPRRERSAAERAEQAAVALGQCLDGLPERLDRVADLIDDPTTRSAVTDAAFAARQGLRLVRDLIDTDRAARGRLPTAPAELEPRRFAEELVESVARIAADYDAVVELDCPEAPRPCRTDAELLARALYNLLDTALRRARRGRVRLAVAEVSDGIRFSVSDGAPPPPERVIATLFDRRNRLESGTVQRGSGLGFCGAVADALGGTVEAEAMDEGGLRLSLTVPRSRGSIEALLVPSPVETKRVA